MFARAKSLTVLAVAALLLTGACGSSNDSQPKVHIKGETSASPSSASPKPEKELQTKFPGIGLEITKIPISRGQGMKHSRASSTFYAEWSRAAAATM